MTEKIFIKKERQIAKQLIPIAISEANSLAKLVDCFSPVYYFCTYLQPIIRKPDKKRSSPTYVLLYLNQYSVQI